MIGNQGSGFRVQGSGFRVQGSGFRVQGSLVIYLTNLSQYLHSILCSEWWSGLPDGHSLGDGCSLARFFNYDNLIHTYCHREVAGQPWRSRGLSIRDRHSPGLLRLPRLRNPRNDNGIYPHSDIRNCSTELTKIN